MNDRTIDHDIVLPRFEDRRLYEGVRSRRIFAFLIDYFIVLLLCIPVAIVIAFLGILTLGLGWMLYGILLPLVALPYVYFTVGGPNKATTGMRMMGIRLERMDGKPIDGLFAVVHSVLFWAANVLLTPLILLATLFLDYKRAVHDMLLGAVIVRTHP
ncbi:RDD family protein [Pseudochrobactrum kiredjianiae]|uniref:RDD family protein n=1 Tax=Pseudochrobactrum kiredjianiae TaxID=386305 RepID=A0ABW3VAV8_9HYPH|nr:RDD family protein [Pseudochrobactrum kiredjianiae]MDM7851539.1 RDD family protein [Pseudochrobactrum kiredjianiae]